MAELIGRGLSNKEIASELGISPATVRTHIYNLYRKVGAGSRVELLNRLAGR
jgi:DNA-binding CsgD family transcriptional regulator